jgi:L-iditol 2-dehydrogenase
VDVLRARLHGSHDLRLHEEEPPKGAQETAQPGWSRVAVTSVGICGSDLHWYLEGGIGETTVGDPVVPGHEFAGIALEGPHAGRRVAVDPAIPCGRCEQCREGHGNLCPQVRFAGHGALDGGMQQELMWPDHLLHPLPDGVSNDAGALLEPLGVAIHAVGLGHVGLGDDVLVVGAGPIGVLAGQVARRSGARRVLVSEPAPHRRDTALRVGADHAWHPEDAIAGVRDATGGRGVDVVIEMAGTDAAVDVAVECARPGARVALGGIPSGARTSFSASAARRAGLTFVMVRRMHETYPRAIELAGSGIDLDGLVTARFPLRDAAAAFESAAARTGDKTVVVVSEG